MPQILSKHPWAMRSLYWMAIAAAYTAFHVISSIHSGKLALPPKYDDVTYLNQGAQWLNAWKHGGLGAFWSAPVAHSPVSVYTAFFGFLVFGPHQWAPYAVNGMFVWLFLLGLDDLAKGLPTYQRLLLPLTALTYPLLANLVMAFRPDVLCSIVTAYLLTLIIKTDWLRPTRSRLLFLGILLGFALLSKPSIFPITIGLTLGGIVITALFDYKKQGYGRSISKITNKTTQVIGLGILVACPYYIFGGLQHIATYINLVILGPNRTIWAKTFPITDNLLYYLNGNGSMVGNWLGLDICLIILAISVAISRRDWFVIEKSLVAMLVFGLSYGSVTIPAVKSPFLGVIVSAILLLASYQALQSLLLFFNQTAKVYLRARWIMVVTGIFILGLSVRQWQNYPYIGGGVHLLSKAQVLEIHQPLKLSSDYFSALAKQSPQPPIHCFLTTDAASLNIDNLRLNLELRGLQTVEFHNIDVNQTNFDRPENYFTKMQAADYVIFPRATQVTYPRKTPSYKQQSINMGAEIARYLDRSPDFEKLRSLDAPAIDGKIEIYGKVGLKGQPAGAL
jgi:hypothetical protein